MNQIERVNKLIAILAIAFVWAYRVGIWINQWKEITLKKQGRLAIRLFRYGLDWLSQLFFKINYRKQDFRLAVKFLSST